MKTFGYLLMAVMACMTCSCRDEEPLPDPVPPVVEPENPGNPEEPDTGKVYLGIAPIIENMQEQRAVVENWKEGHCLGVTAAGDVNIPFTLTAGGGKPKTGGGDGGSESVRLLSL